MIAAVSPHHSPELDPGGLLPGVMAKIVVVLAGFLGAMVRSLTGPQKSWRERAAAWIGGAAMAVYATPVVSPVAFEMLHDLKLVGDYAQVTAESLDGLVGFLMGAVGLTLVEALIAWARRSIDNMPWPPWGRKPPS